jgi:adenylosuccinate synthase
MARMIVLLSGSVASGKSTLASLLEQRFGFEVVKTRQLLNAVKPDLSQDRESLQTFGEELDKKTGGQWVVEQLDKVVRNKHDALILVDAVRIPGQIEFIRRGFGSIVKHIHLHAPTETLSKRYKSRTGNTIKEFTSYDDVLKNETERDVPRLADKADVVVDTNRNTPEDVVIRTACHLGLLGRGYDRVVDVLVGGQYGSEGKGQVAAYLAPEYDVLVRVGGPNAGHSVYEEPEPFVFHSLPSGTRKAPKAQIVIGAGAVVNLDSLWREINQCQLDQKRLTIDPQVMMITATWRR